MNKLPQPVFDVPLGNERLFVFAPNRHTLGGTAYLIVGNQGGILVDSPAWTSEHQTFLQQFAPIRWLVITHRGGMGEAAQIQADLGCTVVVQEQEAYLLPGLTLQTWANEFSLTDQLRLIWTPGHSPGSSCLYWTELGGVLFTGRHLLPNPQGQLLPLRTSKTFHWPRQLNSVALLQQQFSPASGSCTSLSYICPGANIGFLRGQRYVAEADAKLAELELAGLRV